MREAAIVSAARTPIGRAFRGAFNQTPGATMAGYVVAEAMKRAGIDPVEVEDVRPFEDGLVVVRGSVQQQHLVPLGDGHIVDGHIPHGGTGQPLHR